jgi:hypothetical protein
VKNLKGPLEKKSHQNEPIRPWIYPSIRNYIWSKKIYTFGGQENENKILKLLEKFGKIHNTSKKN